MLYAPAHNNSTLLYGAVYAGYRLASATACLGGTVKLYHDAIMVMLTLANWAAFWG